VSCATVRPTAMWFAHLFLIGCYAALAAIVARELPALVPDLPSYGAHAAAAFVFVAAALAHIAAVQVAVSRRLGRDVRVLTTAHDALRGSTEAKIADLTVLVSDGDVARSNAEIVSEMRVLRSLLTQLNAKRGMRAANATGTAKRDVLSNTTQPLPVIQPKSLSDAEVLEITKRALRENRVDLYLQPVVRLPQRDVQFYETFSRIRHEDGSVILPERYIAVAAEQGYISTIDNLLLFRCVQLVRRALRDNPNLGFFCNISRWSLSDKAFFPQFVDFLEHNTELAPVLFFEFGQDDLNDADVETDLARLARLGFGLSIDRVRSLHIDIGALAKRGVKFLKVGADTLMSARHQADLPVHIEDLKLAMKRAGIALIAEKVETEAMVISLIEHNIDFGQGYLFGEPKPSRFEH